MTGFEPRISGVGSDHSTSCATTASLFNDFFVTFVEHFFLNSFCNRFDPLSGKDLKDRFLKND